MPWKEETTLSLRLEFVSLASMENANIRNLCHRFGISPKTGYKWLRRFEQDGLDALQDLSRRPHSSPSRIPREIEQAILGIRDEHPAWGPRKIRALLARDPHIELPTVSTVAAVLKRNGRISPEEAKKHQPWQHFEAQGPNHLWQMDFKGRIPLAQGGYCHPLTILDDHSRFLLALRACRDETWPTVQDHLTSVFRLYGLPYRMIMDNGAPWGSDQTHPYTPITVWLIRLGISVSHSRPYHPQTLGKDERLHRTLKAEAIAGFLHQDISHCQSRFEQWRDIYNFKRPHQALGMATPSSLYQPSPRGFPETLPPIEYDSDCILRKVQVEGEIYFHGREFPVGRAFHGYQVALRPVADGIFDVFFCHERIAKINLRDDNVNDHQKRS